MQTEYASLKSISAEEFSEKMCSFDTSNATKSDAEDLARIERVLDLMPGLLKGRDFYLSKVTSSCGRTLTFYDFVVSALIEGHGKSFVAHTLVGSKYFLQPPRRIRCIACAETLDGEYYSCNQYGCCQG